jgi:hypothetical protein
METFRPSQGANHHANNITRKVRRPCPETRPFPTEVKEFDTQVNRLKTSKRELRRRCKATKVKVSSKGDNSAHRFHFIYTNTLDISLYTHHTRMQPAVTSRCHRGTLLSLDHPQHRVTVPAIAQPTTDSGYDGSTMGGKSRRSLFPTRYNYPTPFNMLGQITTR